MTKHFQMVGSSQCVCVRACVPEFMSFHSWSTSASLHRGESDVLVKGGFLLSMLRTLCLIGQQARNTDKQKN